MWTWQKGELAERYYLQLHTMGGGGYRPQDSLAARRHTKQGSSRQTLFTYTLHLAIALTTAHSGRPLAPKTVALAILAGICCGGPQ